MAIEVELPHYMSGVGGPFEDRIRSSPDASMLVLSCGVRPIDGTLVIVTGDCRVLEIQPNGWMYPESASASYDGKLIMMTFEGSCVEHWISSVEALAVAKPIVIDDMTLIAPG